MQQKSTFINIKFSNICDYEAHFTEQRSFWTSYFKKLLSR